MSDDAKDRRAKAAASETIGKLIGDDAAVRKGRRDRAVTKPSTYKKTHEQE